MATALITRAAARAQGLKRYFTGRPCPKGHVAERYVAKANCVECDYARTGSQKKRARDRAYVRANAERKREKTKQWAADNPERARENRIKGFLKDPEKRRKQRVLQNHRRRAQERAGPAVSVADADAILVAQKFGCVYCGADLRRVAKHLDHIEPLALGGSNDKSNLQWLCAPCNVAKGATDPIQFAQRRLGRLM